MLWGGGASLGILRYGRTSAPSSRKGFCSFSVVNKLFTDIFVVLALVDGIAKRQSEIGFERIALERH